MTENKCSAISEFKMSLTLKRGEPEWLETLQQDVANQALALLIGDDGCQISVPVAILVATSSLVRSISAVLLPPAISPVALSVPGVAGDVLKIVVEIMKKGTAYDLNAEQIQKVCEVFDLMEFGAVLKSNNLECCEIKVEVEVKYEKEIDAFAIGEIEVKSTNHSKFKENNNFSVEEVDIKMELQSESDSEKFKSTTLVGDRQAKRKTQTRNKFYVCDKCEYETSLKARFRCHERIHTDEKPFACDQCKYKANTKSLLMRHSRTHTGEKPYECDQCDYKYSVSNRLLQHRIAIHKAEKPFTCDVCKYKAKKWRELIEHKRIH